MLAEQPALHPPQGFRSSQLCLGAIHPPHNRQIHSDWHPLQQTALIEAGCCSFLPHHLNSNLEAHTPRRCHNIHVEHSYITGLDANNNFAIIDTNTGRGISLKELETQLKHGNMHEWKHAWGNTPAGFAIAMCKMLLTELRGD